MGNPDIYVCAHFAYISNNNYYDKSILHELLQLEPKTQSYID